MYKPQPKDTSGIKLPDDIVELTERLAENAHDVWAQRRIAEGWRDGLKRDDERKLHPNLVSYEELPESEKEYDRQMIMETLKATIAFGYLIEVSKQ